MLSMNSFFVFSTENSFNPSLEKKEEGSLKKKIILTGAPLPSRPDCFSTHNAWQSLPVGDLSRSIPLLRDFVSWFVSVYGFVYVSDVISFSAQHRKDAD